MLVSLVRQVQSVDPDVGVRFVTPGNVVVTEMPTSSAFEIRLSSPQSRALIALDIRGLWCED